MIKIKVCGIKNLREIEYVNELKPDYIGLVFTKSKRKVDKDTAYKLISALDTSIKSVGVFRNNSLEEIISILKTVPLNVIQLHGSEDEKFIRSLKEEIENCLDIKEKNIEIWKAVSIEDQEDFEKYINNDNPLIDKCLVDGSAPGSGKAYSLDNFKNKYTQNNFFLAGGIDENNVIERIKAVHPMGVDVSSGVEEINENNECMKSYEKMKNLINKVRNIKKIN